MCPGRGASFVAQGPVLGPEWWRQVVGNRGAEAAGRSMVVEQVGEEGGGLVMEGFVSDSAFHVPRNSEA